MNIPASISRSEEYHALRLYLHHPATPTSLATALTSYTTPTSSTYALLPSSDLPLLLQRGYDALLLLASQTPHTASSAHASLVRFVHALQDAPPLLHHGNVLLYHHARVWTDFPGLEHAVRDAWPFPAGEQSAEVRARWVAFNSFLARLSAASVGGNGHGQVEVVEGLGMLRRQREREQHGYWGRKDRHVVHEGEHQDWKEHVQVHVQEPHTLKHDQQAGAAGDKGAPLRPDFSLYGLWALRRALEEDLAESGDCEAVVGAAAAWIVYAGDLLRNLCCENRVYEGKRAAPGLKYKGRAWSGFSEKRWAVWRTEFLDLLENWDIRDKGVEELVERAVDVMEE